jgi:DnaJ-class molecular chaperone
MITMLYASDSPMYVAELSYAYEVLNKPSSRHAYDVYGSSDLGNINGLGDDTLHGVLYQVSFLHVSLG